MPVYPGTPPVPPRPAAPTVVMTHAFHSSKLSLSPPRCQRSLRRGRQRERHRRPASTRGGNPLIETVGETGIAVRLVHPPTRLDAPAPHLLLPSPPLPTHLLHP